MNLSMKQKQNQGHREQTCVCPGGGKVGQGGIVNLTLADADGYIQNG